MQGSVSYCSRCSRFSYCCKFLLFLMRGTYTNTPLVGDQHAISHVQYIKTPLCNKLPLMSGVGLRQLLALSVLLKSWVGATAFIGWMLHCRRPNEAKFSRLRGDVTEVSGRYRLMTWSTNWCGSFRFRLRTSVLEAAAERGNKHRFNLKGLVAFIGCPVWATKCIKLWHYGMWEEVFL